MNIHISHDAPRATALAVEPFPMIRFDAGLACYQEALLNGQYLVVSTSAMGRPRNRDGVWLGYRGGAWATRPQRIRQTAFHLVVDSQQLHDHWRWVGAEEIESSVPGCREAVVTLEHTLRPIRVRVFTRLDGTVFLTRWLEITNTGDSACALSEVAPWSGQLWEPVGYHWNTAAMAHLDRAPFTLGHLTEHEAGTEGTFAWQELPPGITAVESMHGRSGWGIPTVYVRNELSGEVATLAFGWSGNWQFSFLNDQERYREQAADQGREVRLYARVSMAGPAPLRVLDAGETCLTPEVHLGFQFGDLDACAQALHEHARKSVILQHPKGLEHRVEINHTGYTRNDQVTEAQVYEEIDIAADTGIELFMLDAGWFGGDDSKWCEAVGDWERESPLLTHGVRAVFDRIHERGMLGGLWVEAERMGSASHILRDHPDWQMQVRGERIPNLDLSRPEVAEYLEATIVGVIERYNLDCFRLDYNISIGIGGEREYAGYLENILWRYYDALYGIFDRIHARFPRLLLENCSSGGGRNDLGIMKRFNWTQTTDKWSPLPTCKISNGVTLMLPPEVCSTYPGAISDGQADLDFALRTGLWGHLTVSGIYPSMAELHEGARGHWRRVVQVYKESIRPIIGTSRMYHHTPLQNQRDAGEWVVMEIAADDKSRAYAGVFRYPDACGTGYQLVMRGLSPDRRYRVSMESAGWVREVCGSKLLGEGVFVPVRAAGMSELVLFEAL